MSGVEIAAIIAAVVVPIGSAVTAIWKAFQYFLAKERASATMQHLKEQAEATVTAKNEELKFCDERCAACEARYEDLWSYLESQTS